MDAPVANKPGCAQPRHAVIPVHELLARSIREHAAEVAIAASDRPFLTYADLGHQLETLGRALTAARFGRGMRIAVALPEGPEFVLALIASCSVACCAPLSDKLGEDDMVRLLVAMRIDALIVADASDCAAVRAGRRAACTILAFGRLAGGEPSIVAVRSGLERTSARMGAPGGEDIALLIHTSGTTGTPKIVPWEQWRVAETVRNRVELSRIDESDRTLVALPLYSSAAIRRVLASLVSGGSLICPGPLSADETIDVFESLSPTQYFAPPASHIALLEAFERRVPRPRHCLKAIWSGTTDLPDTVRLRLERAFSVPVIIGYGMTESGSITQTPFPPEKSPSGSVGRATNIEIAITDEAGFEVASDAAGEIIVRGPEVFAGYESGGEANRAAFRNGWFRTGDAGRIDRDGFVYLLGRLNEIVNRGGVKIAPAEIEAALAEHPDVIEAAAFAIPHPTLGQDLAAAVVLRGPSREVELRRFLRSRLAASKVPTTVIQVTVLPRLAGKVVREQLTELVLGASSEPPIGREETEIARIFAEELQVPGVGRRDNFFVLGGDSLRGARVVSAANAAFGIAATPEMLFYHPTVSEFAAAIVGPATAGSAERPALVRQPRKAYEPKAMSDPSESSNA